MMIQTMNTLRQYQRQLSTIVSSSLNKRRRATEKWLENIVIGEKLCPFAMSTRKEPQLRIVLSCASTHDEIVDEIASEARLLMVDAKNEVTSDDDVYNRNHAHMEPRQQPETTLIVLNEEKCPSLSDFRDLVHLSWRVQDESIVQNDYQEDLQIVLFHPLAVHNTYGYHGDGDAADYTIRSPYPIIHLLREVDVMKAVKSGYKDLEGLPSRNKAKLRKLGLEVCEQRLLDCKQS